MSWRQSDFVVRLLAVLCATAGCAAAPQMSQRKVTPLERYFELIERVGKLEPRVDDLEDRFETGIDALDSRLDPRMDALGSRLESRMDALGSRLAHLDSRLDGVINRLDQVEQVANRAPRDCSELPAGATTGVHLLRPLQSTVEAYCDMDKDGGRWTVFQRRDDIKPRRWGVLQRWDDIEPRQDFYLGWTDYKHGFGNLTGEFWWGLNYLWQLTSAQGRRFELRIDLEDFDGYTAHASYKDFSISSEGDGYRLRASNYTGDAGDSLEENVNRPFSTYDRDQDGWSYGSCAERLQGAWWHWDCTESNLNGRAVVRSWEDDLTGIVWWDWKGEPESLKRTVMKLRPI